MKKLLLFFSLLLPSVCHGAFTTDWLHNTSSSITLNGTTYYWQAGQGAAGQFLTTDGATIPVLTWTTGGSGTITLSTMTPGATNFIFNQNTLQAGATFYVSSGTVAGQFRTISVPTSGFGAIEERLISNIRNSSFAPASRLELQMAGNTGFELRGSNADGSLYSSLKLIPIAPGNTISASFSHNGNNELMSVRENEIRISTAISLRSSFPAQFYDSDSTNYVAFRASTSVTTDNIYVLMASSGTPGQAIITDGNNNLSFATISSGGNGYAVEPATVTFLLNQGFRTSTGVFTSLSPGVMHIQETSSNVVTGLVSLSTEVTGVLPLGNISSGATYYVQIRDTLQPSSTFYVSSGTANILYSSTITVSNSSTFLSVSSTVFQSVSTMTYGNDVAVNMSSATKLTLPASATPISGDCDDNSERGRVYVDTNSTTKHQLYICEGTSGWVLVGGPGGVDTQVQFNDAGILNGDSALIYVKASGTLLALSLFGVSSIGSYGDIIAAFNAPVSFQDADSSNQIRLKAPAVVAIDNTYILPPSSGTLNQAIVTDGSNNLGFLGVPYASSASATQKGNTAATETEVFTSTISANTLRNNFETLSFYAGGTIAGTLATDKRIRVKFGGTIIFDSGNLAITAASDWSMRGSIIRTGAATQKCVTQLNTSFASLGAYADYATSSITLSNATPLILTASGTNANDVVGEVWKVEFRP